MTAAMVAFCALVTLVVGLLLQPAVLRMMATTGVMDLPSERSSHANATPRGGGVAVVAAASAGLMLAEPVRVFMVPLLLFAAIGLLEDLRGVAVTSRLMLQLGVATVTALLLLPGAPTAVVASAGSAALVVPAEPVGLGVVGLGVVGLGLVGLVAVWLAGYANAFNFMDGINGMSAVHTVLAGSVYIAVGLWYDLPILTLAGAVAGAAAVTFLPWNAGRARIFLGDVGSYGLGGLLGAVAVYGLTQGVPAEAALAPLALYLADTGWTLLRRCCRGEAWYRPHRGHAYQRLTGLGWSHQRVTALTALTSLAVCGCALAAASRALPARITLDALAAMILAAYLAAPWVLRWWQPAESRHERRHYERGVHV